MKTPLPSLGAHIEIEIDAMDDEGRGRALLNDNDSEPIDIAIRGAFVGDRVTGIVEKIFAQRRLVICRVEHVLEEGPCRVPRTCPHNAPCPTCPLHGADASLAFEVKKGRIERALDDAGIDLSIDDLIPHPHEHGYRQKVKWMVGGRPGKLVLGVYVPYSHHLVASQQCPYINPEIVKAAKPLMKVLNSISLERMEEFGVKALIMRACVEGVTAILITENLFSDADFEALSALVEQKILLSVIERHQEESTNSILGGEVVRSYGPTQIVSLEGKLVEVDSFCQTDPEQAQRMYDDVAEYLIHDGTDGWFVDGYAGVGGFSKSLLENGAQNILAVEQSVSAGSSLSALGVEFMLKPMSQALERVSSLKPLVGMVLDPAKKGLMEDAAWLAMLKVPRVVLVSCDPDAMAKDLKVFLTAGYAVERIVPLDLFGGAPAIETLVFMKQNSNAL